MAEFRVLGPVEVWVGERRLAVGTPRQQLVLAVLLAEAGRLVPVEVLIDRVWDEDPPARTRHSLYTYLSRLRRVLGAAEPEGRPAALERRPGGYVLEVDPEQVDLHRFHRLIGAAGRPGRTGTERVALLRQALDLWQGTPLADLPGGWAARTREMWQRERLDAVVGWAGAELDLGRPDEVIGPVRWLAGEHPLVEPLTGVLIRALAAAGRRAEALQCYAAARARLAAELGTEPSAYLQDIHGAVLRGEIGPATPVAAGGPGPVTAPDSGPRAGGPLPAQLPADVAGFTGRGGELAGLDALIAAGAAGPAPDPATATARPTATVIAAVSGTAGVGKTALALHWAHRVAHRYPDGQLYVDLRGYDPELPVNPADAVARFLRDLGVPAEDIPLDPDQRAARYRTELAGRRVLIVLDNAATVDQVRPLLAGSPFCTMIVTSRNALAGLVALHGAHRLDLDLLPLPDAVALLRQLIGPRADADPDAVVALATRCARLPLALRIAAELAGRSDLPLADLVHDLADEQQRLHALDATGDPRVAVTGTFSWSLRSLPVPTTRLFRLLGLHPGPELDAPAAAALCGCTPPEARRDLDALRRAHLVQPVGGDRYGMHDLLRAYATQLTAAADTADRRRAAQTRLFDYYLGTAAAAMDAWYPAETHRRPRIPPAEHARPFGSAEAALAWLDTERPVLAAVCAYTATHDWPGHTVALATTVFRYLDFGGHYLDALAVHGHARRAAARLDDHTGQATALSNLGSAYLRQGHHRQAVAEYGRALDLFERAGDQAGQARALTNIGLVHWSQGRYRPAAASFDRALDLFRQTGDQTGQAACLTNMGNIGLRRGQYDEAADYHRQAIELNRQAGHLAGEANGLTNLGDVLTRQGRYEQAIAHHQQALDMCQQTGHRAGAGYALSGLGDIANQQRRYRDATGLFEQALDIFRQIGDLGGQAQALNGLGETSQATAAAADALDHHERALACATDTGERYEQARAHNGIAHAHRALGDPGQARQHWERARTLYTEVDTPEVGEVEAALRSL